MPVISYGNYRSLFASLVGRLENSVIGFIAVASDRETKQSGKTSEVHPIRRNKHSY